MKKLILIMLLCASTGLVAQGQDSPNAKLLYFGFGFNIALESLDQTVAQDVGIAATGATLIDFRGRLTALKYMMLDVGFYVSQFKDKLPFEEAVVFTSGQLSGLPSTATSRITSGGIYYSLGGRLPIVERLYLNASLGQRRFSASRGIPECSDCRKTDIELQAGTYIRGGLSWVSFKDTGDPAGEFDVLYTHYLNNDFLRTISVGFIAYL